MAHFALPLIIDHAGWGPVPAASSAAASSSSAAAAPSTSTAAGAAIAAASSPVAEENSKEAGSVAGYQPVPAGAFMFAELPFQPFNKNEKLWRVSDWASKENERGYGNRNFTSRNNDGTQGLGIIGDDGVPDDEADGAFSLVDNRPKLKPRYGTATFKRGMISGGAAGGRNNRTGGRTANSTGFQRGVRTGRGGFSNQRGGRGGRGRGRGGRAVSTSFSRSGAFGDRSAAELREPSVQVAEEWPLVQDIDMGNLGNFVADVDEAEDLSFAGVLEAVNPKFSYINPRNPLNLTRYENKQHFTATTANDPVIDDLKKQSVGNVYATDVILSALMASPRSVNSWDVLIEKDGDNIYLDKRPSSRLDFVSVNENWNESYASTGDKDNMNHPDNLSLEATLINHNFAQQLLSTPAGQEKSLPHEFEQPNPFLGFLNKGSEPASVAFRYRKWKIAGGFTLVARCGLNGFVERKDGEKSYVLAKALNEFDSKLQGNVDWRQKLESQTGAVLASEMKNNQYKLSRWVSEAVLSGADEMRLGFVSRVNPRNNLKHAILMSKTYTPQTFADSVNVQTRKLWGTLSQILTNIKKLADGNYLLLRDPQKNVLHIYSVPKDAFDHELDDVEEEGDQQ